MPGAGSGISVRSRTERSSSRERSEAARFTSPQEVIDFVRRNDIQIVDLRFTDLIGTQQHFSITQDELNEGVFTDGLGFDGSSIRGFQRIHESDMLVVPDATTAFVDPCLEVPTLSLVCNITDPTTGERYPRDPRYIAQKAEEHVQKTGIADTTYIGPEVEFFVFEHVRFDQAQNRGYYFIDSEEGMWNSGRDRNGTGNNLGYRPRYKEGYFPLPPVDALQDFRSEAVLKMKQAGIRVEVHHHEVATAGQCEIDMRFGTLTKMADQVPLEDVLAVVTSSETQAKNELARFRAVGVPADRFRLVVAPTFFDKRALSTCIRSGKHPTESVWSPGDGR